MAYSPTPLSGTLPNPGRAAYSNQITRRDRVSSSPPAQQPLSKTAKRRIQLTERLNEISANFAENRDANYRKQLQQYQTDIHWINNCRLYDNEPLPESGDYDYENSTDDVTGTVRQSHHGRVNGRLEHPQRLGRHATTFAHEVNNAMEKRDVDLTLIAAHHNFAIQQLDADYRFATEVTDREHQLLIQKLRARLIKKNLEKKAELQKDKEKLDIADTNALLHHSKQFGMGSIASPGGPSSSRKTRYARQRLDAEELDNAINNSTANGKRKRRAVNDAENGSPGSTSRDLEQTVNTGAKEIPTSTEIQIPQPSWTLDRLFDERDLLHNLKEATQEVIKDQYMAMSAQSKRRRPNGGIPPEGTDREDDAFITQEALNAVSVGDGASDSVNMLAAVAMDRTPSQQYHATRSTGRALNTAASQNNLGALAGRQSAADLLGTIRANEKTRRDGDEYQKAPSLNEQEAAEDIKMMQAAMLRETEDMNDDSSEDDEGQDEMQYGTGGRRRQHRLDAIAAEKPRNYVGPLGFMDQATSLVVS